MKKALAVSLALTFLPGCLYKLQNFGGMQPSSGPLKSVSYKSLGKAKGMASSFNLFHLFTITEKADIDYAINEAIGKKQGDALINIRYYKDTDFWFVGTVDKIIVEGEVIKYEEQPAKSAKK